MTEAASLIESAKRAVARQAALFVEAGMRVGLGTGSTTAFVLEELGRRVREQDLRFVGVPTSASAEHLARRHGIPLVTLDDVDRLDVALDGADEVDPSLNLIKGRGAAHTREKIIARLSDRFVVLVDESKLVDRLGSRAPVPVEVLPLATRPVSAELRRLGAEPELRLAQRKDGPVVTDQGMWILDARFGSISDPAALDREIKLIPGVLDHGLFVGLAHLVMVGESSGEVRRLESISI